MAALHALEPSGLSIPDDVMPGKGWSKLMVEMAAYIGARAVLALCERYGGQQVYFPADPAKVPFLDVLGRSKAEALCSVYRGERVTLPTARYAIARAKRGGIIAAVRAGHITVAEAAARLHLRRDTVSGLVKSKEEGIGCLSSLPITPRGDPRQLDMFQDAGADLPHS